MRRRAVALAGLWLLLTLPARVGRAQEAVATNPLTGLQVEEAVATNPLTGLHVENPANLQRNPVIAKVSNAPAEVRPQAGLAAADLVFEHYAEGGLTRFSAVFYGQRPTRVGSIRSARLIDLELLPMLGGLLAWSGASNGVLALLNASAHPERLYMGVQYEWPVYWREPGIPSPHNLFVNVAALTDLAASEGVTGAASLKGPLFLAQPPAGETGPAQLIDLRYLATRVTWVYHEDSGLYYRYADGEPHLDAGSGHPLHAANVVALYADHRFSNIVESVWQGITHYSIAIDLGSGGAGLLFRDGRQYPLRWARPAAEGMLRFSDDQGATLAFKPGSTWLQVMRPPAQQDGVEGLTVLGAAG
ncbi:MAG: DUF3048 domain-containing protein [Anaerolineaceae bacterium]|nr:DUF3048 domain-containing protein [Anaerolineaceae bacterium]